MTEWLASVNSAVSSLVWGPSMIAAMFAAGALYSIRTGFLQVRGFPRMLGSTLGSIGKTKAQKGRITPFQALSTALAGSFGVGNVAGVATALTLGGPGAVFWMWLSALLGMMTKYAEVVLAVHFREKGENGSYRGGPMYYIRKGLHSRVLAAAFSLFGMLASFGIGNMTQSNSMAAAVKASFGVSPAVSGTAAALLAAVVILGGVSRIASVTEKVVPFMGIFYLIGAFFVIGCDLNALPGAFREIFEGAFGWQQAAGGFSGALLARAMHFGVARGVFSNEAGLGSASIVHAAADTDSAVKQGFWGMFEVFADTIVVCTVTALAILVSGAMDSGLTGVELSQAAFEHAMGNPGGWFLAASICLFAFATIVSWAYYGEQCGEYLFGKRILLPYKILYILAVAVGAGMKLELVWDISDTLNGLMAVPNLIALAALSGIVMKLTREYLREHPLKRGRK